MYARLYNEMDRFKTAEILEAAENGKLDEINFHLHTDQLENLLASFVKLK